MDNIKRIIITPGEPAGIGPDVAIRAAQQAWPIELIACADPELLQQRAKQMQLPLEIIEANLQERTPHRPGTLKVLANKLVEPVEMGTLNPDNAEYVVSSIKTAATLCQQQLADAMVTGPVHKGTINKAGIAFTGHTEFLAEHCQVKQTVMLFVTDTLKVALATTHIPLAKVPAAISHASLRSTLLILHAELQKKFHLTSPRILLCGLNPHAGEGGYLGREEIDIMTPLIAELRARNIRIIGPLPADTIFTPASLQRGDAVLAMYHDQALPLVKYASFGHAVNVTLGLPIIRTSVDHGTAVDMAGSPKVDAGSLEAAIKLAIQLAS